MKQIHCNSCGARFEVGDDSNNKCPYCGTFNDVEKKNKIVNLETISKDLKNKVENINWLVLIVCFFAGVIPGLIYLLFCLLEEKK